jgi:hypothetical protein
LWYKWLIFAGSKKISHILDGAPLACFPPAQVEKPEEEEGDDEDEEEEEDAPSRPKYNI